MPTDRVLFISIGEQKASLYNRENLVREFAISTSRNPPSCAGNSFGTPTGLHVVADKIGDGAPPGTVFIGRMPIGRTFAECSPEENLKNLITSRILRLRGLEPGVNSGPGIDSYDRYIYIHGTNHEGRIGEPFSGGCIELLNTEVIELFDALVEGDMVYIYETF